MTPRVARHLAPFFHELGAYKFQSLCAELFHHEHDASKAGEYGVSGQGQRGIDILASLKIGGVDVAQCKCVKKFSPEDIRTASKEFLKHLKFWKDQGVRRFVLVIACDATSTKLQDEALAQRKRFQKHGLDYELWGPAELRTKLRPHPAIARSYIDSEEIVADICDTTADMASRHGNAFITRQLGLMANELEELNGKDLEGLRELCRQGDYKRALEGVRKLQGAASWLGHTASFQARVLRFEAALLLNLSREVADAAALVERARTIAPDGDYQTIDAYLAYCRADMTTALATVASPKTPEAWNFRWALLLEGGRMDELEQEVATASFPFDAETHRILALWAVMKGDVSRAQAEVGKAVELAPTRKNTRVAKAIVSFFSALSPAVAVGRRLAWPVPVAWTHVRRESAAVAALQEAALEFAAWAEHDDCTENERENFRTWQLACVACIDFRQPEAEALCKKLLEEYPASYGVMAWALQRNYAFDHTAAAGALRARSEKEPDHIDVWFVRWSMVWRTNDRARGEAILDEAEATFRRNRNADIWLFHKAQFAAHRDLAEGKALAAEIEDADLRRSAEIAIRRVTAESKQDRLLLAEDLAADVDEKGVPNRLFECCEMKLQAGDAAFIARHAVVLVERVGTASALRLALEGASKAQDYALCLRLLENFRHFFRDGVLSPDVRQLKILCLHQLGDWTEAMTEAERMYREQPNLTTFMAYFDVLVKSGDTRRAALLSRDLLTLKKAKPLHMLRAVSVARLHDAALAKELWRLANRNRIKNLKLAGESLQLAFALGVPGEAVELFKRLQRLARKGRGPLREQSFDQLIGFIRSQRESGERTQALYEQAKVPVHLAAEHFGVTLVDLYRGQLDRNRELGHPLRSAVLFARAGMRPVEPIQPGSMQMDITALLLAADLGVLDHVEKVFAPLYVSPNVATSLVEQASKIQPTQPERHESRVKFLELVRSGAIRVIEPTITLTLIDEALRLQLGTEDALLLDCVGKEQGVLLHDGPFVTSDSSGLPVVLPPALAVQVRSPRLLRSTPMPEDGETVIAAGTTVAVPRSIVGSLEADQLDIVATQFRLITSRETVLAIEAEVLEFERRLRLFNWTTALLDRVQLGLKKGLYIVTKTNARASDKFYNESGLSSRALLDLLAESSGVPDGVTWCDDRMVNRHLRAGNRLAVSVVEVLATLLARGVIGEAEYFTFLLRLRHSNVRYVPLADGELEYHLSAATVSEAEIQESPALAIVRRYVNACLLDRERLQAPGPDTNGDFVVGEFEFVLGVRRAVDDAVAAVWADPNATLETRRARADWLLENLHVDLGGVRQALIGTTSVNEVREMAAASMGALYAQGIGLDFRGNIPGANVTARAAYFAWLGERLLTPRKANDPTLFPMVAKVISASIVSMLSEESRFENQQERRVAQYLFGGFIHDLPEELSGELDLPASSQALIGVTVHEVIIQIGAHRYDFEGYWKAVAEAINGREAKVNARDEDHELTIEFDEQDSSGRLFVRLRSSDAMECGRHTQDTWPVLRDSVEERIRFLVTKRHWFDGRAEVVDAEMRRVALIESPPQRIEELNRLRDGSPEVFYRRLGGKLNRQEGLGYRDLLIPDWARLVRRLHLEANPEPDFAGAARSLIKDEGLIVTLRRLIAWPVLLPAEVEAAWCALADEEAAVIWNELAEGPTSIVGDLHLVGLGVRREWTDTQWLKIDAVLADLLAPTNARKNFLLFKTILQMVESEFIRWPGGRDLPRWLRFACVWYHASRLHGFLRHGEGDPKPLIEWIGSHTQVWTEETLAGDVSHVSDVSRASNITYGSLVLHGLARLAGAYQPGATRLGASEKFASFFAEENSETVMTRIEMTRRADLSANLLGSFLGGASQSEAACVFGHELAGQIFVVISDAELAERIEEVARNPGDGMRWAMLHGVVGNGIFPAPLRERFVEILRTVRFQPAEQANNDALGLAISFACQHAGASRDEVLIQYLEAEIHRIARQLSPPDGQSGRSTRWIWAAMLNALLPLTSVPGDADASARRFFDALRRFVQAFPTVVPGIFGDTTNWIEKLPLAHQVNVWPFILTVRAWR